MDTVLSVLLWGGLAFLMMKFCCGSHLFGHRHGEGDGKAAAEGHGGCCGTGAHAHTDARADARADTRADAGTERLVWEAPEKDIDPVCRMTVATREARPSVYDGQVYYFCSRECREAFEAGPDQYVGRAARRQDRGHHATAKGGGHDRERVDP